MRQRMVCLKCVSEARHPLLIKALKERTLDASTVLAARVGGRCPSACATATTGGCSVATRAALLADFADAL